MSDLIQSITSAAPQDIQFGDRLRPIKRSGVESIRASYGEIGILKDEIHVRKKKDGQLWLICGGHRLTFALEEGWDSIVLKAWRCTDDWAKLMEIDDNLAGADLDPLDTAIFLAERKRVYERMHPEAKNGAKGLAAMNNSQMDTMSVWSFASATAEKFGLSDRHVRRMIAAGTALQHDDIALLRSSKKAVTLADLQTIAKLDPVHRFRVCAAMAGGEAPSAAKALRQINAKPGDAVRSHADKQLRALNDAFARAGKSARRQFVADHADALRELLDPQVNDSPGDIAFISRGRAAS